MTDNKLLAKIAADAAFHRLAASTQRDVNAALAQPAASGEAPRKPDGYAYRFPSPFGGTVLHFDSRERNGHKPIETLPYWFAHPPVAPEPVAALTDARIEDIWAAVSDPDNPVMSIFDFARAIESELRAPQPKEQT